MYTIKEREGNTMTTNEIAFTNQQVDAAYVNSLVDLITECRKYGVEIDKVSYYQHGWVVTFKDYPDADAICHNGSMGSPCYGGLYDPKAEKNDWNDCGRWETIGFPWDRGDVSVHRAEVLARMIHALNYDLDWEPYEGY